jgi:hypothetical protein
MAAAFAASLQLAELVHARAQLRQDFVEEGRPDLTSAVYGSPTELLNRGR